MFNFSRVLVNLSVSAFAITATIWLAMSMV